MAVSQNTQNGLYAKHADEMRFVGTLTEAEAVKADLRGTGRYKRVTHSRWNNGTRQRPRWEYKVLAWLA